jgi:hypothetical protein
MIRAVCGLVALGRRVLWRGAHYISRGVHYVSLGCIRYGHGVYVFTEDLVIAYPPRTGRSPALAEWILNQPDATPATSTRLDPDELGESGGAS